MNPSSMRTILFLLLAGCSSGFENQDDTGGGDGGDGGDGDGGSDAVDDLPDIRDGLDETGCEVLEVADKKHSGAASYFYGGYGKTGEGEYEGEERWIIFANDTWVESGKGYDCEVVWDVSATEVDPECATCELGLAVEGSVDDAQSDCPDGTISAKDKNFTVTYDVDLDDGTATFTYASSGTYLGEGHYDDEAMNYLSEKSCIWW
jgi:hypothetical protein